MRDWLYFHCKLFRHLFVWVPVLSDLNLTHNLYIVVIFIVIILDSTLYIHYISSGHLVQDIIILPLATVTWVETRILV